VSPATLRMDGSTRGAAACTGAGVEAGAGVVVCAGVGTCAAGAAGFVSSGLRHIFFFIP
jgi:hypothetical protein